MSEEKKSPIIWIVAALAILVAGGAWFMTRGGQEAGQTVMDAPTASEAGVVALPDLFLGEAEAPIEVVEYASFTCPHCATFHANVYPNLKRDYIETGKVKFVFREVYFDQYGLAAGLLARCGGDLRYFGLVDLLMEKQSEWARGEGEIIVQNLYRIGRQAGLENDQMQACLSDKEKSKALVADYQLKAGQDEINSTPSFVINGEKMSNMGWDEFKAVLDAKLN